MAKPLPARTKAKRQIIREYRRGASYRELASKYDVSHAAVRAWIVTAREPSDVYAERILAA